MEIEIILKKIDVFPWNTIKCLSGECDFIPKALKEIISKEKNIREKAYWDLDNHIVVQGGLYEGAFFCIPFLLELIKSNRIQSEYKEELYELIFEIANGASSKFVGFQTVKNEEFEYHIPDNTAKYIPLQIACRNEILKSFSLFTRKLFVSEIIERRKVLELLSSFDEHESLIRSTLEEVLKQENDAVLLNEIKNMLDEFDT